MDKLFIGFVLIVMALGAVGMSVLSAVLLWATWGSWRRAPTPYSPAAELLAETPSFADVQKRITTSRRERRRMAA